MLVDSNLINECRKRLIQLKVDILNRTRSAQAEFIENDKQRGDEADQSVAQLFEDSFLIVQKRLHMQLLEIEMALARIEIGTFGICEETDEPIEPERLLAIPWTRLSIEGAEMRESLLKRFASNG